MSATPYFRQILMSSSMSQGYPPQCTATTAFVLPGTIFLSTSKGSMQPVQGLTSAQVMSACCSMMGEFVATQVTGVVTTSVSGPTPARRIARRKADVQVFTVSAFGLPTHGAIA